MQPITAVAVIGLGAMGGPAARALRRHVTVTGYDPVEPLRAAVAADGVRTADTAADAATGAELIVLSLPTPDVVRSVVAELGDLPDGTVVADLSTIDPGTARSLAADLSVRGVHYVDAPVLGRPAGCGSWTLPCGGDPAAIRRLSEVAVGSIASNVERVGASGAGATLKICNNLMFATINAITAEVVDLAEHAGLDPAVFAAVVGNSGAATVSGLFTDIAPRMAERRYDDPTFAIRLLAKDVGLGADLAAMTDRTAPVTEVVKMITDRAMRQGLSDLDTAAVVETYRRPAARDSTGWEEP